MAAAFGRKMNLKNLAQALCDFAAERDEGFKVTRDKLEELAGGTVKLSGSLTSSLEGKLPEGWIVASPDGWQDELILVPAPTAKKANKKFVKFAADYQESEGEKPKSGKSGKSKEKDEGSGGSNGSKFTVEELKDMVLDRDSRCGPNRLKKVIKEYGLDLDFKDMKEEQEMDLKEIREAVAQALEGNGSGEEDEMPSYEDLLDMSKKQLKQVTKDWDLDVDLDEYKSKKKAAKAIYEALEAKAEEGEDDEDEDEDEDFDED